MITKLFVSETPIPWVGVKKYSPLRWVAGRVLKLVVRSKRSYHLKSTIQGRIQDFKLGGGGALKKIT